MKKIKNSPIHLVNGNVPFEFAEAYKALRTNFNFAVRNGECKKVLITSAIPNEGKSSVAINLAISLAQTGKRVLLVDADLRNPSLHRYLNLKREKERGLSFLLVGSAEVEDCIIETVLGFDIIVGGQTPPNPAELLESKCMENLLATAQENYDVIICDTPPVGLVTDAAVLSAHCDGVLLVVRQKSTKKNQVMGAVHKLNSVGAKILGVILNHYDMTDAPEKDYGYYSGYAK